MRFQIVIAICCLSFVCCKKEHQAPAPQPESKKKAVVTTVAGTGQMGFVNGASSSAKFSAPHDVVVLSDGTLYVTDLLNRRIRKISNGQVSSFVGDGIAGTINGNGNSARVDEPGMLALDQNNNMYLLDGANPQVRRITPNADVSVYAGSGLFGHADGTVATATFSQGWGILVDPEGNVIVADTYNNSIRKISNNGVVSTLTGSAGPGYADGNAASAKFNHPYGIAMDNSRNIYIADNGNYRIRKLSTDGIVSTFAGSGISGNVDGNPGLAQFSSLTDMVFDKLGNLILIDASSIRKIAPSGLVSTILTNSSGDADGDSSVAKFYFPTGLAINADGDIYVADNGNHKVKKISFVPIH